MDSNSTEQAGGAPQAGDRIERNVTLAAPRSRVWQALTDHRQFGEWFKVELDGPFRLGEHTGGHITYPGYEHLPWDCEVTALEPEEYFAFRWPQFDHETQQTVDYWTLVEFRLADAPGGGTKLTISESGFDAVPEPLRTRAFTGNSEGWSIQAGNIKTYVEG
jgi:uncharacterized protein YndB with AHSA1/START domain